MNDFMNYYIVIWLLNTACWKDSSPCSVGLTDNIRMIDAIFKGNGKIAFHPGFGSDYKTPSR